MLYFVLTVFAIILIWQIAKPVPSDPSQQPVEIPAVDYDRLQYFGARDNGNYVSVWPKVSGIGRCVEFHIAGITFRGGAADRYLGEFVGRLVPESNNPHDPNSIRIEAPDGTKVGYVPKDSTYEVRGNATLPCSCCCFIARHGDHYITCCYIKV